MCGIAGKLHLEGDRHPDVQVLARMARILRHRGPDDAGYWACGPVGLASSRLAIIDLSARGRQPMASEDGTLHIVFNGEIYNFQELRTGLLAKGYRFRSSTDTETLLYLYDSEGIECLRRLRGMFAFAIWDSRVRTLFLARDRLGKKPLFYYRDEDALVFASEPKAILQDPDVNTGPDPQGIHHFLTYGYLPGDSSAFRAMRKLPPAHYMLVRNGQITIDRYWSLHFTPKRSESTDALGEELLDLLEDSVRLRLISDVPVGALLSGGLDSSAIVSLMRRVSSGPVRTFSIGFSRTEYDELEHARRIAREFETEHHELVVTPDAVAMLPRLVWHYNEPFADSSALPSFYLCQMAGSQVKVAINGDGGDEAFIGYDRYRAAVLAGAADRIPLPLRRVIARAATALPDRAAKSPISRLGRFGGSLALEPRLRYGNWLAFFDQARKTAMYTPEFGARVNGCDSLALLDAAYREASAPDFLESMVAADMQLYLPGDLLVKMDIASMAHSLEVRSPFLDHRVVEFAASLPARCKLRGRTSKYLLKRVMRGRLPPEILRRRKMGFGVPIDHWLRHELKDMTYDILLSARATARGYFRPEAVKRLIDDHVQGRAQHHSRLWSLLMLELWHQMFVDRSCPVDPPATL